jgi:uncharacterized protein (TIGR03437 family)
MPRFLILFALAVPAAAQSLLIGNAAFPDLAGYSSVAPGSLIVAALDRSTPLPAPTMIGLQVQPAGSTNVFPLPVIEVRWNFAFAVMPENVPLGQAGVTMTVNGVGESGNVTISPAAIGLFSSGQPVAAIAVAQNLQAGLPPALNRLTNAALRGQYVTLWGTGIGKFKTNEISVEVYGIPVQPTFAGHAPGQAGVDQIDFQIPQGVAVGCYVPLTVTAGGRYSSNQVTISITETAGAPCVHPLGLTGDQLKRQDAGGTVPIGSASTIQRTDITESGGYHREEQFGVSFAEADAAGVYVGALMPAGFRCSPGQLFATVIPGSFTRAFGDAGAALTFAGPGGRTLSAAGKSGSYSKVLDSVDAPSLSSLSPPFFVDGTWTLSAPGGADIPGFQRSFILPQPLVLTNRESLTNIDRNADLVIAWEVHGHSPNDRVVIMLGTVPPKFIFCDATLGTGKLVIGRDLLREVPLGSSGLFVSLTSAASSSLLTTVPLRSGEPMPISLTTYSSESIPIVIR